MFPSLNLLTRGQAWGCFLGAGWGPGLGASLWRIRLLTPEASRSHSECKHPLPFGNWWDEKGKKGGAGETEGGKGGGPAWGGSEPLFPSPARNPGVAMRQAH